MKFLSKILLTIVPLLFISGTTLAQDGCQDLTQGGLHRLIIELKPGVPESVKWDFSQCAVGIQNFTAAIHGPRKTAGGATTSLNKSLPISIVKRQFDDGVDKEFSYNLRDYDGQFYTLYPNGAKSFSQGVAELEFLLDAKSRKSVFI